MGLSRWGERVEKAMQPRELTAGELITQEAERVEVEQIAGFIYDWISKRTSIIYKGSVTTVERDELYAIYVVHLRYRVSEDIEVAVRMPLRDEDIAERSQTTRSWSTYMDGMTSRLIGAMRRRLREAGVDAPNVFADEIVEELEAQRLEEEEQAALQSIKQTIAARQPDEA